MKRNDFIGQMVHETIQTKNKGSNTLLSYRPKVDVELTLISDKFRKCYIIQHESKRLEIPYHWGPFNNRISREIILDQAEDHHLFLSVFNEFFQTDYQSIKFDLETSREYFQKSKAA